MWESSFSPTSDGDVENIDSGEKGNEKRRRICQGCELKCRTDDAKAFGDMAPEAFAMWASRGQVVREMKKMNKGWVWTATGMHYNKAIAICQEVDAASASKTNRKEASKFKSKVARELAEKFVSVIKSGRFFGAFMNAGSNPGPHQGER